MSAQFLIHITEHKNERVSDLFIWTKNCSVLNCFLFIYRFLIYNSIIAITIRFLSVGVCSSVVIHLIFDQK